MNLSRRDFLKAAAALVAAGRLTPSAFAGLRQVLLAENAPRVIWLQGAGCNGCSVSLLNTVHFTTIDDLLESTIDLDYHNTLMAAAGDLAVSAAESSRVQPGYILVVEGAVPVAAGGAFCHLWPGMTMYDALLTFAPNAAYILAVGTCAAFGGVTGGAPNPTGAFGVGQILGSDERLVNIPGCPAHPDWMVGTITYLLTNGRLPPLDADRRPVEFFGKKIHANCFNRHKRCGASVFAPELGQTGCLELLGCKGKKTSADCYVRQWNSGGGALNGVNWCIGSKAPCLGCVEPGFPDGMSPFFAYSPTPDEKHADRAEETDPAYQEWEIAQ